MAELSEKQEQNVSESNKVHRSRSGFWFGIITLLIIIALAGAGFFLFTQLREEQASLDSEVNKGDMQLIELSKQISGYQSQLASVQSQLATLEASITGKDTHFNKTLEDFSRLHNEKLDSTRKELNTALQQVQRQLGKTRGDWLIADAEYLLSTANERLHLIGDVNTARQALEAADQRLRESGDAAVFKVREQIAKDIAALNRVEEPDIVGMYSAIQTQASQIDDLTLFLPYAGKTPTPLKEPEKPADETQEGQDLIDSALSGLEEYVTIRHTEQPIKATLTQEEAQFIKEQLRLKLESAKVALVQRNEPLYLAGLADAKKWAEQHFMQDAQTKNFIAELDRMKGIQIHSQYPDISLSLKMLRDIVKLRIETDKAMPSPEPATEPESKQEPQPKQEPEPAVAPAPQPESAPAAQ
ncbi:uroporphyrinogen-III C-methyltransferase [Methylobacter sp. YRD-M1]|uniref:uroporphyrinogen-III C-methyltransferase n=1 Tax=Methylobacter sp. YRD-M1 TaxID=2911520 RepID=UPI00227D616F|nr:uroporphyrinogen-III C-methyltransferase [Methylobacter sp. YRD-M1]WAK01818.1 uroporphyrinogen-III C-methyltransferase [Methylobacter sp. YRD-M1]